MSFPRVSTALLNADIKDFFPNPTKIPRVTPFSRFLSRGKAIHSQLDRKYFWGFYPLVYPSPSPSPTLRPCRPRFRGMNKPSVSQKISINFQWSCAAL
jgi:hypothetical protein